MQTILGAGGEVSYHLAKALTAYTDSIRLVSRNPKKVNENDELVNADLLQAKEVDDAVKGSSIVYLTVGLPYSTKIWSEQWPVVMQNVITACKKHQAKLVFFDNIYMYGRVTTPITEETPHHPNSKKGKIRAAIVKMINDEVANGSLTALIARAPEFYGPGKTQGVVNALVFDNIKKGKKLQWMLNDKNLRTLIYTPDAGRATALLGNTADAFNQTWHLPCPEVPINGVQFIDLVSKSYGKKFKYMVLHKWMVRLFGLINPYVKEMIEMLYQFEEDYIFVSQKFKNKFPEFIITPYKDGIDQIIQEIKGSSIN